MLLSILRVLFLLEGCHSFLLSKSIDVGSNNETDKVEERNPSVFRQELLGEGQSQRAGDPANLHDREETGPDHSLDVLLLPGTSNDRHAGKVNNVLDWRDNEIADQDLENLGAGGGTVSESALEDIDEQMTERGRDEGTVDGHHGHTGSQIASMLLVAGNERGEKFLEGRESSGRDHLRLKRVRLEQSEVRLDIGLPSGFSFDRHDGRFDDIPSRSNKFSYYLNRFLAPGQLGVVDALYLTGSRLRVE